MTRTTDSVLTSTTIARLLLGVAILAVLAVAFTAASGPADARFPINNFTNVDDSATATPGGHNVAVSGWVKCTAGEVAEIRVTVTQDDVEAAGRTHVRCVGESTVATWEIHVTPRSPASFDTTRSVRVDAWAVTRSRGQVTDGPHTWSNTDVTLVGRR